MEFLEQLAKSGQHVPALQNRPKLLPECRDYWQSFCALDASRDSNGYGANPIRISEIAAYLAISGVAGDEGAKLFRIVKALDGVALSHYAEKSKTS